MIHVAEDNLPIAQQCKLLSLARSSYYYEPVPESKHNLRLMRMIDEAYLIAPFHGSRQMTNILRQQGEVINRKRVQRLMRAMGLEAMYAKPKTSVGNKEHYKYPYQLKGLEISFPNHVWGTDITYIPIEDGYIYLTAVLDIFSRYVISWTFSDSLESDFCIQAVENALKNEQKPKILNSDQGVQYTSKGYTGLLKENDITISMSGKGRCWDNIFVERLWRSLKYEEVYLKSYSTAKEAIEGIDWYFHYYNNQRLHQKLGYKPPRAVYYGK